MNAMQDQELSPAQVVLLTRAMLSVAKVDGIHPAEAALIGQFYDSSRSADMPPTTQVLADTAPLDLKPLAGSPAGFADTVVRMCLMTGHADGVFSAEERAQVQAIATALGVDAKRLDGHLAQVRDDLVGALSHLPDAGSVAKVVGALGA